MKNILLLSCLLLFSLSCKTNKSTVKNLEAKIIFGEGGGFAGGMSQYVIFDNGQVLYEEGFSGTEVTDKGKIKKKELKGILKEMKELNFTSIDYHHAGNMYRFVGVQLEDSMHTVMWPINDKNVNAAIPALYNKLQTLVKKTNE